MNRHFLGDSTVLLGRSLRHITRSLDTIITTAIMPIAFMLLFVYVFGGAIQHGPGSYVTYLLIFLPFISSAFVPTGTMPGPVRAFAEHQPVTAIVNTTRDLLTRQPVGTGIWIALAWCAGILVVAYGFAMAAYRRKIS